MSEQNSNIYTGQIASPPTRFDVGELGGRERVVVGNVVLATNDFDADGDIIRLCKLPSNARVTSIMMSNDDLGTSNDMNIGLYADEGALIDEDEFATGVVVFDTATTVMTEHLGSGIGSAELNLEETLWERAGLTADTGLMYEICLTQTAAVTEAAGDVAFIIKYTVD